MSPVVCAYCSGPVLVGTDGRTVEPGVPGVPHRCRTTPAQRAVETRLRGLVAEDLRRGRLERNYLVEQFLAGHSLAEVARAAGVSLEDVRRRLRSGA